MTLILVYLFLAASAGLLGYIFGMAAGIEKRKEKAPSSEPGAAPSLLGD